MSGRRAYQAALVGIVLLGAALRLFPIWFGLPYPHARPDEETTIGHAAAILRGDPNPHFFNWPSLTFYVLASVLEAATILRIHLTPGGTVVLARAVIAVAGTATIVVMARLGARVGGRGAGLIGAGFLAVAVLHVRDSHFAMTDVLMTLLLTVSLTFLVEAEESGSLRDLILAGIAGGLAASTKYSAAAIVVAVVPVQWTWLKRAADWRAAPIFLALFACAFVAATPFALLDSRAFASDLLFESRHLSTGHGVLLGQGWTYHLSRSLPYGLGAGIFAAAIAGIVPLARHHRRPALILAAFAAAFFAAIGSGQTVFFRYVMPLVPVACISAAAGVSAVGGWLASRTGAPAAVVVGLLAALAAAPSLWASAQLDRILSRTDTRVLAAEWLTPRLRGGDTLHDAGGDYARLDLGSTPYHDWKFDRATGSFGDPGGGTPDWIVLSRSALWTYASAPPELEGLVGRSYDLVSEVRAGTGVHSSAVYDLQDAFFLPIAGFAGLERPGPDIRIFHRR